MYWLNLSNSTFRIDGMSVARGCRMEGGGWGRGGREGTDPVETVAANKHITHAHRL